MADAVRNEIAENFARGTAALRNQNAPPFVAPPGAPGAELARLEKEKQQDAAANKDLPKTAAAAGRRHTRRTRRRHRTRKSRRRGGYTEKVAAPAKRRAVLKALTRHWRNKQQSHEVLSRSNERGMEMLRRQAALRAKYNA